MSSNKSKLSSVNVTILLACLTIVAFYIFLYLFLNTKLANMTEEDIRSMSETILPVEATLFGLSTLSGAIFLNLFKKDEKSEAKFRSKVAKLMTISFLCFWLALISSFTSLIDPSKSFFFVFSIASTISGSLTGSIYLMWNFIGYLESKVDKTATA